MAYGRITLMIPSRQEVYDLWEEFALPEYKRRHCTKVAGLSCWFAGKLTMRQTPVNVHLLEFAALLHDIDKAMDTMPGDRHPDAAVRMLNGRGMQEVARVISTHPLHTILDASSAPQTWEQKLLFLADKMTKQDIIGVDERFRLWHEEHLPPDAVAVLSAALPRVKVLEEEFCTRAGIAGDLLVSLAREGKWSTMG